MSDSVTILVKVVVALKHSCRFAMMLLCTSSYDTMLYIPAIVHLAYIYEFSSQSSRYLIW